MFRDAKGRSPGGKWPQRSHCGARVRCRSRPLPKAEGVATFKDRERWPCAPLPRKIPPLTGQLRSFFEKPHGIGGAELHPNGRCQPLVAIGCKVAVEIVEPGFKR